MSIVQGIAVFYVMWWVVLIGVLPWGVKTAQESGEQDVPGQATSAPQNPMVLKKMLWTTAVTTLLFCLFKANIDYGWISIDDLPGPSTSHLVVANPKS